MSVVASSENVENAYDDNGAEASLRVTFSRSKQRTQLNGKRTEAIRRMFTTSATKIAHASHGIVTC